MTLDDEAFDALQRGDARRVKQIFLGPELKLFDSMARGRGRPGALREPARRGDGEGVR